MMNFHRLVQFHIQGRFCVSLAVRVSNSGHPITYSRQLCVNKLGYKIYYCMSVLSTRHHTLLHSTSILHTKTIFAPECHSYKIYQCISAHSKRHHTLLQNPMILHTKTSFAPAFHPRHKILST